MSITDELRKIAAKTECANGRCEKLYRGDLEHIADRIDAEHEAKVSYWQDASYKDGYDEGFASADDWLGQHEDAMAEHGWVKLPVDADGVPIHIGDELEDVDNPSSHGEVHRIELTPDACWVFVNGFGRTSNHYRHHHEPTVEDVLRSFADEVQRCCDTADTISEYAAKLRLAGGDAE